MKNRFLAVILVSIIMIFMLFFYLLKEISDLRRQLSDLVRGIAKERYAEAVGGKETGGVIGVVIPAYNEEATILEVLQAIPEQVAGMKTLSIVVVDGARDNTESLLKEYQYPCASHIINRGQGDALRTGFEIAISKGFEVIVTMDADGQHVPSEMEGLVLPIIRDEADLVIGSRFLGRYEDSGGTRELGIVLFTKFINLIAGTHLTDVTNGFRAIRTRDLLRLELREARFSAPELILEAAQKCLRIKEVPVTVRKRKAGRSKKPRGFGYPFGFGMTIIKTWLKSTRKVIST